MRTSLKHEVTGDGRELGLLLIHPLGADLRFWDDCIVHWRSEVACISLNLRHSVDIGGKPDPVPIEQHVADLEDLRGFLRFRQVVPIGCAIGSMIAAAYAARHARRTAALVLSNATPRSSPGARQMLTERAAVVLERGMSAILPEAFDRGFLPQPRDERYRRYYEAFAAQPAESYAMAALASAGYDVGGELKTIACPALVIAGGHDILLPPSLSQEVAGLMPNARLRTIPEAAHYVPYQCPELFSAAVLDFLSSVQVLGPSAN
jgi:3-oxoadipate enol-lactonase